MAVDPKTIAKGKCYSRLGSSSSEPQNRRVYEINENDVIYESWGGGVQNHTGHLHRTKVSRVKFAEDVDTEIPCPTNMDPLP